MFTDNDVARFYSSMQPEYNEIGECSVCFNPIYEGDSVYEIDDVVLHSDCLEDFFSNCLKSAEDVWPDAGGLNNV